MERTLYDLSHFSFSAGKIGRLQTLSVVPIVAGDSIGLDLNGLFRLSSLRRNLTLDAVVDLFTFFVPHRHIYSNWVDFIKEGLDEDETLAVTNGSVTTSCDYLGQGTLNGAIPEWLAAGYNKIWNRYFRVPTDLVSILDNTVLAIDTDGDNRPYGKECAWLEAIWNRAVFEELVAADYQATIVSSKLDLQQLSTIQGRYKSQIERQWFGQRYNDILNAQWGAQVNTDADERPTLIMRKTSYLSGYDVDGQGDANLGEFSGKAHAQAGISFPPRFFSEAGAMWTMALIRFPMVTETERHYLVGKSNPTYKEIAGDPDVIRKEPPINHACTDFMTGTGVADFGLFPYGQWYRSHPSTVHPGYDALNGYCFYTGNPGTQNAGWYVTSQSYDQVFQTNQLGHWNAACNLKMMAKRVIPPARSSIFAGVT